MNNNKIIDGKLISSEIREKIKKFGDSLKEMSGKTPGLAVVLVGENPASRVYVRNKIEKTKEVGFNSIEHKLSVDVTEEKLLEVVEMLNNDKMVDKQGLMNRQHVIKKFKKEETVLDLVKLLETCI